MNSSKFLQDYARATIVAKFKVATDRYEASSTWNYNGWVNVHTYDKALAKNLGLKRDYDGSYSIYSVSTDKGSGELQHVLQKIIDEMGLSKTYVSERLT